MLTLNHALPSSVKSLNKEYSFTHYLSSLRDLVTHITESAETASRQFSSRISNLALIGPLLDLSATLARLSATWSN